MGYPWKNWHQQVSYDWTRPPGSWFAYKPRWSNPTTDMPQRTNLVTDRVTASVPMQWPVEYHGAPIDVTVRQTPWQGSVGGKPVQHVDKMKMRRFMVDNKYGGELFRNGMSQGLTKAGEQWEVMVPRPVREAQDGWAVEGYPNMLNDGDRHWYGLEDDGTAHECIWLGIGTDTMLDYCRFAPDGTLLDGVVKHGRVGVVKGNVSWLSLAWNAGDAPHRLGLVFHNLAREGVNGAASDGTRDDWTQPAYGQVFRLSAEVYNRLSLNADAEQQAFLDSARHHGFMPYDVGGATWKAGVGMVAGAQHTRSTVSDLELSVTDLELVVT